MKTTTIAKCLGLLCAFAALLCCSPPIFESLGAARFALDDGGADAGDAGSPVAYSYMVLRAGQSNSLEQAVWSPSVSLYPWTVPANVAYWHINSARTLNVTTFGPLGGKFGTELSDGKDLAVLGQPVKMSTVAIGSTRCVAALPGNSGYNSALHLAIAAMIAVLPAGPFPVPLNLDFDNGTSDAQASSEKQSDYYGCLTALDADLAALIPGRRFHWNLHRISVGPGVPPAAVPSLAHVQAAEDQFAATRGDVTEIDTAPYAKQADGYHYTDASDAAIGSLDAAASVGVP